ncbi:MAG: hypothetical protein D6725_05985 [Planctomycetota bacterium]|nr:MAG: hypothetical protein D6725_05985 [Planctomycetota bacterium]
MSTSTRPRTPHHPVLSVTRYDKVSATMLSIIVALVLAVVFLAAIWYTNRLPPKPKPAPIELIELAGGFEDGDPNEALDVQSPEEEIADPALEEEESDETQIEQTLENVVELAEESVEQAENQLAADAVNTGKKGSSSGTGRRPLGLGPGTGGLSREQRWYVEFGGTGSLDEYAKQLDFFGIELGALMPDGKLYLISQLSKPKPRVRVVSSGAGENRLYMTWRGGSRRRDDLRLFRKAGIDASKGVILHFYPPETEEMLARLELEYRNKPVKEIRRTFFQVRPAGSGYKFVVTRQTYLR